MDGGEKEFSRLSCTLSVILPLPSSPDSGQDTRRTESPPSLSGAQRERERGSGRMEIWGNGGLVLSDSVEIFKKVLKRKEGWEGGKKEMRNEKPPNTSKTRGDL